MAILKATKSLSIQAHVLEPVRVYDHSPFSRCAHSKRLFDAKSLEVKEVTQFLPTEKYESEVSHQDKAKHS